MSTGQTAVGRVIGPALSKIMKMIPWRKHNNLLTACKTTLEKLETVSTPLDSLSVTSTASSPTVDVILTPLLLAVDTAAPKIVAVAVDAVYHLFSQNLLRLTLASTDEKSVVSGLIESVCKCGRFGDEAVELAALKAILAAVRSPKVSFRGEFLSFVIRSCYNVYLGSKFGNVRVCAKAVLAQIVLIVFTRVEEDSMSVNRFKIVSVSEVLEFSDRDSSESSFVKVVQGLINEVMLSNDGVNEEIVRNSESVEGKGEESRVKLEETSEEEGVEEEEVEEDEEESRLREDGYMLFRDLCKLSMKFSSQEYSDDQILLKGKILSLELLKVIMDNCGLVWRSNERFINIIKQFLCLSLLKNSAVSVMTIFQLLCSIFMSLLSKFRSRLKDELGIFLPMLILRVLENVLQPIYIQKLTVLNILEKISQDPQLLVDIYVNYDCDLDAPNLLERTVNGLLKTALGPPSGSTTTLAPAQDLTFRVESVKCLVKIAKSTGTWMDQQRKIGDASLTNKSQVIYGSADMNTLLNADEGMIAELDQPSESNSELPDAATLEQRRAYKLEMQKGISLFNRRPSKGIDFLIKTKKVGESPEAVASFLKNSVGLNSTVIGDYLGERDEFPLKVMHAYVDAFNFEKMDFGEAIRYFLRGFRLPGEAQKIDRIMEKFAERYCKCNPNSFKSADTAYVLAYSVIMLNTDAHNSMVKDKMTKADFIRNNRGIDDGKDLPEEYIGALYDQIVNKEIEMNAENSQPQSKQVNGLNRLLGFDGILNLVMGKQLEEKPLGANRLLVKNIQEQFKAKSGKSESVFYAVSDVSILRFMAEVCWGPMLAAFSMTLDRSDDKLVTLECLQGFRYSVHVTAVLGMQTERDAFVTSLAKFTYLHCAADMKQKNVDSMKTMMTIAIEDGNYLHESWEHILTCLSRFEHLQLLGEGVPAYASFLSISKSSAGEAEPKSLKSSASLKKKGSFRNPAVAAVVKGGSYDSSAHGINSHKLVTPDEVNNFIANLHFLDQIGSYELNHIYAHSQRLNSEAIVSFVRALCKVSISELQSPTDPRVFSLTKIVEIAHYNMNRIRIVWSRIWNVLSDFFVSVGLSENLAVAIFVMDSLRQLAMEFLEREELANYNFQNEFLRPFVIVMQKSNSREIRELIVRCISQMVLNRVRNVRSGWKSVFTVFTTAAADERKTIVLLAFETMEKIVREYFPYITETESTVFTDCVRCLLTFTNSKFDRDVSFNAIAFLRFCAVKLAEGGLFRNEDSQDANSYDIHSSEEDFNGQSFISKDENVAFWMPLLTGLSKLTSDPRRPIRKSAMEVLFDILKDHGVLFSRPFWNIVFKFVVFPLFRVQDDKNDYDMNGELSVQSPTDSSSQENAWDSETSSMAAERLIDLFVTFFSVVRSQLPDAVATLTSLLKTPGHGSATVAMSALVRLTTELGSALSEDDWREIFIALKDAAISTIPGFLKLLRTMDSIEISDEAQSYNGFETSSDYENSSNGLEDHSLLTAAYVVSRMKNHISVHLVIIQVVADLFKTHHHDLSTANIQILLELFSTISSHANQLNSETGILQKLKRVCSIMKLSYPPVVRFQNETLQHRLNFLDHLLLQRSSRLDNIDLEEQTFDVCVHILQIYLDCAAARSDKSEELAARTPLLMTALGTFSSFPKESFKRYISRVFPYLIDLVRSEHNTGEVPRVLGDMFQTVIGPIIINS
ncbi:hypothetical protein vseg_012761 [Gypsophila vaccaria]